MALLADTPASDEKAERKVLVDGKWVTVTKAAETKPVTAAPAGEG
ncbi:MAG: hypothetical protein QM813_05945 [Verrucomicrobiota bacterium]